MSTINPTNDTSYYMKELARLEKEDETARKRIRAQNEEQLQDLETRYMKALARKDQDNDKAVDRIRDLSQETLAREREKHQDALDRLKDQTYNNRGISGAGHHQTTGELEDEYHQGYDRLQNQIENERKETRHREIEDHDRLDNSYKADLSKKEKDMGEAVEKIREGSKEVIDRERNNFQKELEEFKKQSYNSKGLLSNTIPYNLHKQQIREMQDAIENQDKQRLKDNSKQKLENLYENDLIQKNKEAENSLKELRDASQSSISKEMAKHQEEVESLRNKNGEVRTEMATMVPFKQYEKQLNEVQERAQKRHELDETAQEENKTIMHEQLENMGRKETNRFQRIGAQHAGDIKKLEDQIATLNGFNAEASKKQADLQARIVREYENMHRAEARRQHDSYEAVVDKIKEAQDEHEIELGSRTSQSLKEKDLKWSDLIAKENLEHHKAETDLQNQFRSGIDQITKERKLDLENAERATASLIDQANEQRNVAMSSQAKAFSNTLNNERKSSTQEIEILQHELQKQKTTADTSVMSPAAEANMRKALIKEYEKLVTTEAEKNKLNSEDMHHKFLDREKVITQEYGERAEKLNRQAAYEKELDQMRFFSSIADLEDQSQVKLLNKQREIDRKDEILFRNFSTLLERQRREFEHSFAIAQDDASQKLIAYQRESELASKMAQRAFTKQQNELTRDYEKKLADQQAEFDSKYEDLKIQSQIDLRDAERRASKDLEAQAKGYEQRFIQLEAQYKERERYLLQNSQDEIDKLRRSYEFTSKKKS